MVDARTGSPTRKRRKSRPILGIKRPSETAQPASNEREEHNEILDGIQAFEAGLRRSRNEWSIRQHRRGLFGRKLDRSDADRALKLALAEIGGGQ